MIANQPLRVLQVPPRYAPFRGGVEVVAQSLAEHLHQRGHPTSVLCADVPAGAAQVVNGIIVKRLRAAVSVANTQISFRLPATLLRSPFDVVHTHLPTPWWSDWAVFIGRLRRRATVITFYNDIVGTGLEGAVAAAYRYTIQRLTLTCADAVIVQSPSRLNELARIYPQLEGRLHCIGNGVDTERFAPPDDATRRTDCLLFVGRLDRFHRYKGLDTLITALAAVPNVHLDVVGDGELRREYEALACSAGVRHRMHFLGDIDDQELVRRYRNAGVFVLPSSFGPQEGGSSLVVLEAMSCGLPVVVAEGAGDIAHTAAQHGAGLAVPANDANALAGALRTLVGDPGRRAVAGQAARAYVVRTSSWDAIVDRYVHVYRAAVDARGRRAKGAARIGI